MTLETEIASIAGGGILKGVEGVVDAVGNQINKKATLKAAANSEELQAELSQELGQVEVNKIEASSLNVFIAGWRPAAGWICVFGMGYQFLVRNILGWLAENLFHWTLPPDLDIQTLMTLLFGLLGLSTLRSADKYNGVASK